ncbi:MAG: hypothetical protein WCB57_03365 [Pseudonocardiaceae bacterium]
MSLVAICLDYFMVILDTTIVKVALPALREHFDTSVSGLQWVALASRRDGVVIATKVGFRTGSPLTQRVCHADTSSGRSTRA